MTVVIPDGRRAQRQRAKARRRVSVVGVVGELFITAGVVVLLFLGWELWFNDIVVGQQMNQAGDQLSEQWSGGFVEPSKPETERPDPGEPIVAAEPADIGTTFATMIIPRFGADYNKPVAEGVTLEDVLNPIGIGHYPGTAMPGGVGNAAFAAHRTTFGAPFGNIADLRVGDSIYIETQDGWYQYKFRSFEWVLPSGVGVIDPVPQLAGVAPTQRLLTMTSCNPKLSAAERIVAYSVYETWYPRADGVPEEIAHMTGTASGQSDHEAAAAARPLAKSVS
jgi:sortase A